MGLTGRNWCCQHFDVLPDLLAFGKKAQVCGVMAGPRLDEVKDNCFRLPSRISSTWGGNFTRLCPVHPLPADHRRRAPGRKRPRPGRTPAGRTPVAGAKYPVITAVRGRGLMLAFDLPEHRRARRLLERRLRTRPARRPLRRTLHPPPARAGHQRRHHRGRPPHHGPAMQPPVADTLPPSVASDCSRCIPPVLSMVPTTVGSHAVSGTRAARHPSSANRWLRRSSARLLASSDIAFPLTPALSLRERENRGQSLGGSWRANLARQLASVLPLPKGEGRGEGEQTTRPPEPRAVTETLWGRTNSSSMLSPD